MKIKFKTKIRKSKIDKNLKRKNQRLFALMQTYQLLRTITDFSSISKSLKKSNKLKTLKNSKLNKERLKKEAVSLTLMKAHTRLLSKEETKRSLKFLNSWIHKKDKISTFFPVSQSTCKNQVLTIST